MCDPRLNSQRVEGRDRDAGCDWSIGTEKRDRVAMPPDAMSDVVMLNSWMSAVEDMVDYAAVVVG
jgi:hypothetical protein